MLGRIASHYKSLYVLHSEVSQTHSLTMNSQGLSLSETWELVNLQVSESFEGKDTIVSTWDCWRHQQSRTRMLWFLALGSWLCIKSLLGNTCFPGIPRNGGLHRCVLVFSWNTRMFCARKIKFVDADGDLKSFSEMLPSCGTLEESFEGSYGSHKMAGLQQNLFL